MSAEIEKRPVAVKIPIITIDGPSGSGKGTIAHRVASRLGYHVLDSGSLYRLLGAAAERHGVALDNEAALEVLAAHLDVQFLTDDSGDGKILLEGEEVTNLIRTEEAGRLASQVAALPKVRNALLARQQAFCELPGLVADGRDMGTVVFPHAELKVFLTASAQARAERRYRQLLEKGFDANLRDLVNDIQSRDDRDMNRSVAPLRPAHDALVLDSTDLGIDAVLQSVFEAAKQVPVFAKILN